MAVIKDDMISERITRRDMLPLSFLKKSAYTGSKRSLNYKLEKTEIEIPPEPLADNAENGAPDSEAGTEPAKKTVLRVYSWVGKFAFDATPREEITVYDAEFSDAGIDEAIEYLNGRLENL